MRSLSRALAALGAGFAVSFIAACGGGAGLLSGDQANTLNGQLDKVSSALSAGDCNAVANASQGLGNAVSGLPSTVNSTLRADLSQGASTVSELAVRQCHQATATTSTATTATTTTATTTTASTPTSTTSTATTPTTPATTLSTSGTTSTTPSGGGGLSGGGGGGGNSNG